ncbi:hypothetical protein [Prosthecomicrobium sp. N25]|uniref:hypothetical protein n=1 Tax=Prosthecomicrobium sp. N25 TaxID=3129254 RepID=UPI003077BD84
MDTFQDKLTRIAAERDRLARGEASMREDALAELERINAEIESLEQKKESLEALLGLEDSSTRAGRGQIVQLCLRALSSASEGMTSAEVRDWIEADAPGTRLQSVPSTLSRLINQGRLRRDEAGRYFVV